MSTDAPLFYACLTEPVGPDAAEAISTHFEAHKAWLKEHEDDIFIAGPLLSDSLEYVGRGLIILRAESLDAARGIAESDPMHSSGTRTFRVAPWRLHEGCVNARLTLSDRSHRLY